MDRMDVFEAVRTVLAVRQFREQKVPAEIVRRIVEAGRLSASGSNRQPRHFIGVEQRKAPEAPGGAMRTGPYIAEGAVPGAGGGGAGGKPGGAHGARARPNTI